ncbi:recombination-associated protein RdgC, partial [Desulforegula conservatrix]|uniref:recombination-associated protein RdgC n=1 Tax=Desulforegula conservatrix TaxID=153026 RepID=UPI00055148E3
PEIEDEGASMMSGWTGFSEPYDTDYENEQSFFIMEYALFSLRIDTKDVPARLLQKHVVIESKKRLSGSGKSFLTKAEKKEIKESVYAMLFSKAPLKPSIHNVLWDLAKNEVHIFAASKAALEDFETLFSKSFGLRAIRLFPYTLAEQMLNPAENAAFLNLIPSSFRV